jgi:hypothetical protein
MADFQSVKETVWLYIHWRSSGTAITISEICDREHRRKDGLRLNPRLVKAAVASLCDDGNLICASRSAKNPGYYARGSSEDLKRTFMTLTRQAMKELRRARMLYGKNNPLVRELEGQARLLLEDWPEDDRAATFLLPPGPPPEMEAA